jgi:hypothetical protein
MSRVTNCPCHVVAQSIAVHLQTQVCRGRMRIASAFAVSMLLGEWQSSVLLTKFREAFLPPYS